MTVESVFSTTAEEALEVHRKYVADVENFAEAVGDIKAEFGRDVYTRNSALSGRSVAGLDPNDDDIRYGAELPDGLRLEKKRHPWLLVPAKRTPRGKELAKQWGRIHVSKPTYPGMPSEVLAVSHVYWPGFHLDDNGVLWATWGTSAERILGTIDAKHIQGVVDTEMWQQRKLSEYYAMKEAQQEKAEAGMPDGQG